MAVIDAVDNVSGMPAAAAALASANSPRYQHSPAAPVGAMAIGTDMGLPNNIVAVDRPDTSTKARCRSFTASNAERFDASAIWSSVARSTNSNTPFGSRRLAAARRSAML